MNLNDIQLDQQKKILIVIFAVLIIYVDSSYILKPQMAGLNSLNPKIARLERDLKNLNRDLDNMRNNKNKPNQDANKIVNRSSKIIAESQISGLLQDISTQANKFDVKIIQIRPARDMTKTAVIGDKLIPVLINLDLICDYHSLGKFINSLENDLVFMGVFDFKISTQVPDYIKQKVTLVIRTYVSK
ncbi:MAG: type 4a pilus biogenesis protein PilO [Candidatus Omnitrophota bacterium]